MLEFDKCQLLPPQCFPQANFRVTASGSSSDRESVRVLTHHRPAVPRSQVSTLPSDTTLSTQRGTERALVHLLTSDRLDKLLGESVGRTQPCSSEEGAARGRGPQARTRTFSALVLQVPVAQELCDPGGLPDLSWLSARHKFSTELVIIL